MPNYFAEINDVELSILYYLETEFATEWPGISVVNAFEEVAQTSLPVICIELTSDEPERLEVGSNTLVSDYLIVANIYANDNTQRKALAYLVRDLIRVGCTYYTHTSSGGTLSRTSAGWLTMRSIVTDAKIDFGDSAESYDHHRHNFSFTVRKNT